MNNKVIDCTSLFPKQALQMNLPECEVKPIDLQVMAELSNILIQLKALWIPYSNVNFELPKNADPYYLLVLLSEGNSLEYCVGPHLACLNMYTNDLNGIHLYDHLEQNTSRINHVVTHWLPVPLGGKWL